MYQLRLTAGCYKCGLAGYLGKHLTLTFRCQCIPQTVFKVCRNGENDDHFAVDLREIADPFEGHPQGRHFVALSNLENVFTYTSIFQKQSWIISKDEVAVTLAEQQSTNPGSTTVKYLPLQIRDIFCKIEVAREIYCCYQPNSLQYISLALVVEGIVNKTINCTPIEKVTILRDLNGPRFGNYKFKTTTCLSKIVSDPTLHCCECNVKWINFLNFSDITHMLDMKQTQLQSDTYIHKTIIRCEKIRSNGPNCVAEYSGTYFCVCNNDSNVLQFKGANQTEKKFDIYDTKVAHDFLVSDGCTSSLSRFNN
jgi:hypothetical protein